MELLCAICDISLEPRWHGGSVAGGYPCEECPEGDLTFQFILPVILIFAVTVTLVSIMKLIGHTTKTLLFGRLPEEVPIRPEQDMDDVWEKQIQPMIKRIVVWSLQSAQDMVGQRKNSVELYGYDFMIDEQLNPWLIEINSSPDCSCVA